MKITLRYIIEWILWKPFARKMNDKTYLRLLYWSRFGKVLHLKKPKTFSEKLQWLKIYDKNQKYVEMVDKDLAKQYVGEIIGGEYIIPTIGKWESVEEIKFDSLPNQFVLKCTHDSGGIVICRDKTGFDIDKAKNIINNSLKNNYYFHAREWPYKYIKPKIIAECFMNNNGKDLEDYKIHCFNGQPEVILVCRDRYNKSGLTEDFFSIEWNHLNVSRKTHPNATEKIPKPKLLKEMLEISKKLSKGIPFVRVDLYIIEDRIYFGELTLFPASGLAPFVPESFDSYLGEQLILPQINRK